MDEDQIFYEDIFPFLGGISDEGKRIWSYVFMEMMNNAIEHSRGEKISCRVVRDILYTEITIVDDGTDSNPPNT